MRLIDADELLARIRLNYNNHQNINAAAMKDIINTTKTAYDIEKVVAELEKKRIEVQKMKNDCIALSDMEACDIESITYDRAIDIVRKGGVE